MKNLKKLSAVFFMTVLFSVSFTSCIDNEVSPLVEEIYAAQADLLAAQARVQDAEAAYLEAQAAHEQAMADYDAARAAAVEAETANNQLVWEQELLLLTAETAADVAAAEQAAEIARLEFEQQMAELMAQIEAAGVELAMTYAEKYQDAMEDANDCLEDKLDAEADLADAQLLVNGDVSYEFYVAQMQAEVAEAEANRDALAAAIANLEAYMANPDTPEAMISDLEDANAALQAEIAAKEIALQEKYNEIMAVYEENDVRADVVDRYEEALADLQNAIDDKEFHEDEIEDLQEDIAGWEAALADYDAALAALEADVEAAAQAVADAEAELGMEDGNGDDVAFGAYFEVDADGDPLAADGVRYDGTTLQGAYANARMDNMEAQAAYTAYAAEYAALVESYNEAATELANAQADYDAADYEGDLAAAQAALVAEQADFAADMQAYEDAKATFEADPNGSQVEDGPMDVVTDLGEVGLQDGPANTVTYMRVETWTETVPGSGEYVPASFYPTKYNEADLATEVADLIASTDAVEYGTYSIDSEADVVLWSQDGTSVDADGNATLLPTNGSYLTAGEVQDAISVEIANPDIETAYFVEVETDDEAVTNLYAFNVATNELGLNDFSDRPYTEDYLIPTDPDAGYDSTPDANGEADSPADMLTAYAELWNAEKLVAEEQEDLDEGEQALIDAQAEFDAQKDLFENGAANLATLEAEADAAAAAEADAKDAVDEAWVELGVDLAEGEAGDAMISDPDTLNEELFNAEVALADFLVCDDACLQENIANANEEIAEHQLAISQIQPIIDAKQAVVDSLQDEYDEYIANEGHISSLDADLHAQIIALWQEYWLMENEIEALEFEIEMNEDLIEAYEEEYGATDLGALYASYQADYEQALVDVEEAQVAYEQAQNEETAAEAYIAYYEAMVEEAQACYDSAMAIAAEYKALMEAALAS